LEFHEAFYAWAVHCSSSRIGTECHIRRNWLSCFRSVAWASHLAIQKSCRITSAGDAAKCLQQIRRTGAGPSCAAGNCY